MPLMLTGCGGPVGGSFSPASLTGYVDSPYSVAQLRSAGKLWQDTAKTVPAVADSDPVRVMVCGALEFAAPSDAARPLLWAEGGGKWSLSFDGVDDRLSVASASFKLDSSLTVVVRLQSPAVSTYTLCSRADLGFDREWQIRIGGTLNIAFSVSADGASFVGSMSAGLPVDTWGTFHGWYDLPATTTNARLSGGALDTDTIVARTTDRAFAIGYDPSFGGSEFFAGRIAGLIVCRAVLSADEFASADAYLLALTP